MNNTNNTTDNTAPDATATDPGVQAPPQITGADIPLALKARYFGSGVAVGVLISPMVRNALSKLQPKLGELMEGLTTQAEGAVEKGSDLLAMVKQMVNRDKGDTSSDGPKLWN